MEFVSSADAEALRSEVASLRKQLDDYRTQNGSGAQKLAGIHDLSKANLVLESITDAFFGVDERWLFAYLNREAERLLGRSRNELIGKELWQEFPASVGTAFEREYQRALREHTSVHFEEFYGPLQAWFEVRAYPLADGLAVYFQDVSDRKRTERDLLRREAELRTILDSVPVIVSSVGPDQRFRQLNRRFTDLFNKEPEWAIGRTLEEVAAEPHITIARPYVEEALRGKPVVFDSVVLNYAGELRDIRAFYVPQRTPEGELDGFIAMVDDITDRKRSELALRNSENRFRSLFDVAAAGMALFGAMDWRVRRVNARFAELLGYSVDEIQGVSFAEFSHPDELADTTARLDQLVQGSGQPYQLERRYLRRDGSIVWGQSSVSLIRNATGQPAELVLVVEDITDRKVSEEALRESENRLRIMAESLPQLVWTCHPNGDCEYLSRQWAEYTGIPAEEQLGWRWLDLVMHPDDKQRTYEAWMAAVRDEADYDLEYRLRRHDGEYRWFKTRGTPLRDSTGKIVRWFGTCTDVHDQRLAEEERRRLLEREQRARKIAEVLNGIGPMLLTELDTERLIQKVTDLATNLIGAQFGAFFHNHLDAKGESYTLYALSGAARSQFADFPMPRNTELFAATFAGTSVVLSPDVTADPRYGRSAPFYGMPAGHLPVRSYLAVPVTSRAGEVIGGLFFGHAQDGIFEEQHSQLVQGIAAQAAIALDNARLFRDAQRSEEALRASNFELRRANADLEQFAYAAAHDLQEPLRMVTSYTQLLERSVTEKLDERTRMFMQYIIGGASRMSLLLQDLLAYTEATRAPEAGERVYLDRALGQVIRNLQPAISESGAEIVEGQLPCVQGREPHFIQLLQNLISNAIKYRKPGVPPHIEISSERQENRWIIRVRDDGLGIDPAYHRQVFGVFKRLHGSEIPGTGIGLAICQRVVERAGGEIWVESENGKGSTFVFTLPVLDETN